MGEVIDLAAVRTARQLPAMPACTFEVGDRVRFTGTEHVGIVESLRWLPERRSIEVAVRTQGVLVGTIPSRLEPAPDLARPVVMRGLPVCKESLQNAAANSGLAG